MEGQALVRIPALHGDSGGRKKEFVITPQGREAAEKELRRLRELTRTAEELLGGAV